MGRGNHENLHYLHRIGNPREERFGRNNLGANENITITRIVLDIDKLGSVFTAAHLWGKTANEFSTGNATVAWMNLNELE